jgi:hypothetical protein
VTRYPVPCHRHGASRTIMIGPGPPAGRHHAAGVHRRRSASVTLYYGSSAWPVTPAAGLAGGAARNSRAYWQSDQKPCSRATWPGSDRPPQGWARDENVKLRGDLINEQGNVVINEGKRGWQDRIRLMFSEHLYGHKSRAREKCLLLLTALMFADQWAVRCS